MDALHSVILRQKSMAAQIGTEIVQQNEIIDDIGEEIFQFCVSADSPNLLRHLE